MGNMAWKSASSTAILQGMIQLFQDVFICEINLENTGVKWRDFKMFWSPEATDIFRPRQLA